MPRRTQLIPWKSAGRASERYVSGDDVVRETGWVFNNAVGDQLTVAEFVATGDDEVPTYLDLFGLRNESPDATIVEIGSGIGRMTCALTRDFGCVIAGDLDAGFLERCRETVARFGKVDRLRTLEMPDGRSLDLPTDNVDVAFSYITLQHCEHDDALHLASEAVRVTRPGGRIALNLRSRSSADVVTLPLGALVRTLFRVPGFGNWLSRRRTAARLAWQANRLEPRELLAEIGDQLDDVVIWRHPDGKVSPAGAATSEFDGINEHHWWLVATVRDT
ncbi:MAG: class I SAM-dependent methyltransferase [Ilumatobacter sp.]|nr:MAG: class I SAM-dependent methyltransferase [Ilumatobacter sp.]